MSASGSLVNTLAKYVFKMFAFSLLLSIKLLAVSLGLTCKLDTVEFEDHKNVKDILNNVLEIADVPIINLYRLGGKGQNRNLRPRLLLATLNSKDKQHEALANTWKLKGNQEWKKVYVDPDRTPEQRKEHNKLLEEMRARRNNGEQVFLAQGKIKVRRQHFAREDNGAANVTSKVKDNIGSKKVSENHKEDVAQKSGADTKHETN